ncbi:MAG: cell surface protein SprA, partial [Crocinitomicaceae bacterium]|nr:cell surface protein SprA [Crocinitomicaceae bacterium]
MTDATKARNYCYFELYDSTKFSAIQLTQYDKFFIRGSYTGAANNEIPLNSTNVPKGSVRVTANGAPLTENVDFIVDYNLGRVKIVNTQLLSSNAVIRVSSESNNLFQVQQKTLMGARFDYKESNDLLLGGTVMYLTERPLTPKVNIGEEPISNLVVGLDGTYKKDSRFLTKMVDRLPFIETKEPSNITLSGEYAQLIPGIQSSLAQSGTAYLDDFEASETPFDLRMGSYWALASTPQGQPDLFPEGDLYNSYQNNYRRANLSWYTIASTFYRNDSYTPAHIKADPNAISNHRMREVLQTEIYRNKQIQAGLPQTLPTFDLTFYPNERGPYNFNVKDLNFDGSLKNPKSNWGGIMRKIDQNDFEQANIDYIEIWVQDPFADNPS